MTEQAATAPDPGEAADQLVGIGAAAARAGVSERALRYYQELGLIAPACTPGGLRRFSEQDLARVSHIRELQGLLGLNLDEIAVVLRNEDRMAQIRRAYHETTSADERTALLEEFLVLHADLRAAVEAKRVALDEFLTGLDTTIAKVTGLLQQAPSR